MSRRLRQSSSGGNLPRRHDWETYDRGRGDNGLLSARSAGILGASFAIAVCASGLACLAMGGLPAGLPGALLAGGAAFAGAVRLLIRIID
ncbi:MAG TPA: hypothetical protein VF070_29585 [Streptosporangiaceae bacterium]